jgi:hypothetical protein
VFPVRYELGSYIPEDIIHWLSSNLVEEVVLFQNMQTTSNDTKQYGNDCAMTAIYQTDIFPYQILLKVSY